MLKLTPVQILAVIIFIYSAIVMLGWIFNIDALTRILASEINMKFTSALAFCLGSVALWFIDQIAGNKREIAQVILPAIAILILLIMTTLIAGGLFGTETGISELFVRNLSVKTFIAGMPSPPTMFAFIIFGLACLLTLFESSKLRPTCFYVGIQIILVGIIACFGYLLHIPLLYYKFSLSANPIALNTALMFVLLGYGLILSGRGKKNENKP